MTDPVTAAIITTSGAIVVGLVTAFVHLRKAHNASRTTPNTLPTEATTNTSQIQARISDESSHPQMIERAQQLETTKTERAPTKLELVNAARSQGRRVCGCTETGEIMLLKRLGLTNDHRWECPHCKRREKADDVPPHQRQ